MSYKLSLSQIQTEELKTLQKTESNVKIYKRLQCVYLVYKNYSKTEVADILDVSNNTITTWIKLFQKGGFKMLTVFDYKERRKSKLFEIKDAIRDYVNKEVPSKIAQVQEWIRKTYGIEIEHSWLYRYLKKNSIYLIKKQD